MPSSELNELKILLQSLSENSDVNTNLKTLRSIKSYVMRLKNEQINQLFFSEKQYLNNLFSYTFNEDINSDYNLIKYNESSEIFEKILFSFSSLNQIFDLFNQELLFIFSNKYESFQLLTLKALIMITKKNFSGKYFLLSNKI
jgi:hypothetical protein